MIMKITLLLALVNISFKLITAAMNDTVSLNTAKSDHGEFTGSTRFLSADTPFQANITTARRELISLENRWDVSVPRMFTCMESGAWIYRFTISNYVADEMIGYQLFRGDDCEIDITFNDYLVPYLTGDATIIGYGTVTRQVALVLMPDPESITSSPIFTTNEDGSEVGLAWCMRLAIFTKDGSTLVNWRDIEVDMRVSLSIGVRALEATERRLAVDCSNGVDVVFDPVKIEVLESSAPTTVPTAAPSTPRPTFFGETLAPTVTASSAPTAAPSTAAPTATSTEPPTQSPTVEQAEEVTTTNQTSGFGGLVIAPTSTIPVFSGNGTENTGTDKIASTNFLVEAFLCTSENLPVDPNDQAAVRVAGSVVRVCVQPNAGALSQGLYLRSVDSFYFSKNDTDFLQFAIEGGESDFLGFTEMACERGSELCYFETIMRATLFNTTGIVVGHGVATLQFGNATSRRFLSAALGDRELIQKGNTRYTGFGLSIPVLSRYESELLQISSDSNDIWPTTLLAMALYIIWVGVTLAVIRHKRRWVDPHHSENDGVMVKHTGVKDGQDATLEPFISNDASQVDPEIGGKVADQGLDVVYDAPKAIQRDTGFQIPESGKDLPDPGTSTGKKKKDKDQEEKDSQEATLEPFISNDASQVDPEIGGKVADQRLDVVYDASKAIQRDTGFEIPQSGVDLPALVASTGTITGNDKEKKDDEKKPKKKKKKVLVKQDKEEKAPLKKKNVKEEKTLNKPEEKKKKPKPEAEREKEKEDIQLPGAHKVRPIETTLPCIS